MAQKLIGNDIAAPPMGHTGPSPTMLRRRRLVAGAATLVAGLMAKGIADAQGVAAANSDPVLAGATTHATRTTYLSGDAGFDTGGATSVIAADASGTNADVYGVSGYGSGNRNGIYGTGGNNDAAGVYGIGGGNGPGVRGLAGNGIGVFGESNTGPGVRGTSGAGGAEDGVRGLAFGTGRGISGFAGSGIGAQGNATTGKGVEGLATSGIAVNGQSTTGPGVRGTTAAGSADDGGRFLADKGRGVAGFSNSGIGVYASASTGYGVLASVGSGGVAAVYASSSTPNTPAFYAVNYAAPNPPNSNAGFFIGQVYINGPLVIAGGAKSAAVPHPDGTHRLLYCMESPESWFEDFGTGTISGGKAEVKLDPDFAAVVDTSKLHVFTESHDEHHALHIAGTSTTGFTVGVVPSTTGAAAGKKASDLSGSFTYRVVAKRKDVAAPRLAKFDLPKPLPTPPVFATSDTPATPKK